MTIEDVNFPVDIDDIFIADGRRAVNAATVTGLARSIKEIGLRHPITVRKHAGKYILIAGRHRIEAFRKLGRDSIPAVIVSINKLHSELWEIDENLCRSDLSPAETATAVARRKAIYEALYPATKHGGERSSRQNGDLKNKSENNRFTKDTADASGKSERSIQRDAHRGEALGEDILAAVVGTSLDKGDELDALAKLGEVAPERQQDVINRAAAGERVSANLALKQVTRTAREHELGKRQCALPDKKYGVILADPEWSFKVWGEGGMSRHAANHYPVSETETIAARDIESIATDDCVLFMWATSPMLLDAIAVMKAWGFTYKSQCIWDKEIPGTGYWFINQHEILLVGTRGDAVAPAPGTQFPSIMRSKRGEHSTKPDWQYDLIKHYFPTLPKIELNARRARDGWDAWGLEAPQIEAAE